MNCPFCGSEDGKTIEVRRSKTFGLRRTRICQGCGQVTKHYGGATEREVKKARETLTRLGYLKGE